MPNEVKVKLNFINSLGGTIASVVVPTPNEVSEFNGGTYAGSTLNTASDGADLFFCGKSICGNGGKFYSQYDGYISNVVSSTIINTYGTYDTTFNMQVYGTNIKRLTFIFDETVQEFPTRISINNIEYSNNNNIFVWGSETALETVNITFVDWNKPNSLIRFTGLMVGLELTYDRGNGLKFVMANSQCQQNTSELALGVVSQNATVEIVDAQNQIVNLSSAGIIDTNVLTTIYLDGKTIGVYQRTTDDGWDINRNTNEVSISLTDRLQDWQKIDFNWGSLQLNKDCGYVLERLIKFTVENTDIKYDDFDIEQTTLDWLGKLKVPYCYLEEDTLWNEWNKLCNAGGLQIYQKHDGKIKVRRFI